MSHSVEEENSFTMKIMNQCKSEKMTKNKNKTEDVDIKEEIGKLRHIFKVPENNYELKVIRPILESCPKFDTVSGNLHIDSKDFLILSRGRQGPAISIAAIATSHIIAPDCWDAKVIDQIVKDGDTYYTYSYRKSNVHNRYEFFITDLLPYLKVQNIKFVKIKICDADFAGNFQSDDARSCCLTECLESFFKTKNYCVLTSPVLNIALWKVNGSYYIFDGQPRNESGNIVIKKQEIVGSKLFILPNLKSVIYIILKKSKVHNEPFVMRQICIKSIENYDNNQENVEVKYAPNLNGYRVVDNFQAVVRGSFYLETSSIVDVLRNKSYLILAVSSLIYSHLVDSNKWSTDLIDLIFDQANAYLIDFVLYMGKTFDQTFDINVSDLLADFILGVYISKISADENVIPGVGKKAKILLEDGLREFFKKYSRGVIEVNKVYYAIWRFNNKYYFFDPFACDKNGFRLNPNDPEDQNDYKTATSVVFMTSSIRELAKVLAQNIGITEKNPFIIHGILILYIKMINPDDSASEVIIYRAQNTRRRPSSPEVNLPLRNEDSIKTEPIHENEKGDVIKKLLEITHVTEGVKIMAKKFPEQMKNVEIIILTEETEKNLIFAKKFGKDYKVEAPDVVTLQGKINCFDEKFDEYQGQNEGVLLPAVALIKCILRPVLDWSTRDIDDLIETADKTYKQMFNQDSESDSDASFPQLDISTFPRRLSVQKNEVIFEIETEVDEVDTSQLEELQSALENYFETYNDMVLEVTWEEKYYAIWKDEGTFYLFNPYGYGTDVDVPATLFATNNIVQLVNAIQIISAEDEVVFHHLRISSIESEKQKLPSQDTKYHRISTDESVLTIGSKERKKYLEIVEEKENEKEICDLKEKLNSPDAFTLFLISCDRNQDAEGSNKTKEEILHGRLKSAKPYLFPNKRILCTLLEAKQASKSVQSLLSRFSVDSTLPMKAKKLDNSIQKDEVEKLNIIKLSPNIYFYSEILPEEDQPIKTIKGFFIKKPDVNKIENEPSATVTKQYEDIAIGEIKPVLVPLGPIISTPVLELCSGNEGLKRKSKLNPIAQKYDIIFNFVFENGNKNPNEPSSDQETISEMSKDHPIENIPKENSDTEIKSNRMATITSIIENKLYSFDKFSPTIDEQVKIIKGSVSFQGRSIFQKCYYKPCFFSSLIMILIKSIIDVQNEFSHLFLDYCILQADKYYQQSGKLRYKNYRRIFNLRVSNMKFNVIIEEVLHGDPANLELEMLCNGLEYFFINNKSGILVFQNICFAFWIADGYYLFDSYGCNENGLSLENGDCALTFHTSLSSMINRIVSNIEESSPQPYLIYKISISYMSPVSVKSSKNDNICVENGVKEKELNDLSDTESSLDSSDEDNRGFMTLPNMNAAFLDVPLVEDTEPLLVPSIQLLQQYRTIETTGETEIKKDLAVPVDLCIMAWSQINDPSKWDVKTFKALYEASKTNTVYNIISSNNGASRAEDNINQFNIENYCFRAAFAPLFHGNNCSQEETLQTCLKKTFEVENYSGAIVCLGDSHVGAMKNDSKFYAWWAVKGTNNIRMVTADLLDDVINLISDDLESKSVHFTVRPVRVSYANKDNFDWISDLHERFYDPAILFKQTVASKCPIYVFGTTMLRKRYTVKEPEMKKCYFVALVAILLKRDFVMCVSADLVDKIIEIGTFLYKKMTQPKHYSPLMLHKVPIFNRIFDFRDHVLPLVKFKTKSDFIHLLKIHLKKYLRTNSSGIIQFTNCCYAFWYSPVRKNYYYLDPYGCTQCGRKPSKNGNACLGIFPSLFKMVKNMYLKMFPGTTGFFIHRLTVISVNIPLIRNPSEDPIWMYLDFHWKYENNNIKCKNKTKIIQPRRKKWNFYNIEVNNCIYSLWGSIGAYDAKFGDSAGKNKTAICVSVLISKDLVKGENWSSKFLDFNVLQGHKYYIKSQEKAWKNSLGLQPCWTIPPYFTWDFIFSPGIFGKLYDNSTKTSLREILEKWLTNDDVQMAVLECADITLGILKSHTGFYIVNPCYVGLPIFPKNQGAVFVLRCQNFCSFLYSLVKSINLNQQIPFSLISFSSTFYKSMDSDGLSCLGIPELLNSKQKSLSKTVYYNKKHQFQPVTVQSNDSLDCFEINLSLGLVKLHQEKHQNNNTCKEQKLKMPKTLRRVKCGFPRLIDFLEGLVTSEKIPIRQKVYAEPSIESYSPISRKEFKYFTNEWKKKLYMKYFYEKSETETNEGEEFEIQELDYTEGVMEADYLDGFIGGKNYQDVSELFQRDEMEKESEEDVED